MSREARSDRDRAGGTDITRLLEAEAELEALLARARDEAQSLLEAAYADAGARSSALDHELAETRQHFVVELDAERARHEAQVLAEGKQRAARLDATSKERITELGGVVLARLLSETGE